MHDDPARYALEHAHYVEDLAFWRDAARRSGGPVLDLGCAVGRVAIPLAEDGHEVWALDSSAAMLAELRSRAAAAGTAVAGRVNAVRGDMCAFAVDRRFVLAIAAMNTLQTLLAGDRQLACLRTVREHLAPGGELLFDVALPDVGDITSTLGVVRHMAEHHDPQTGATLLHSAWYESYEPLDQTLRFTIQIDQVDADGRVARYLRHHEVHLFLPAELAHLLARAGLEAVEILGDWDGAPVEPGSERQIYRCRAA